MFDKLVSQMETALKKYDGYINAPPENKIYTDEEFRKEERRIKTSENIGAIYSAICFGVFGLIFSFRLILGIVGIVSLNLFLTIT